MKINRLQFMALIPNKESCDLGILAHTKQPIQSSENRAWLLGSQIFLNDRYDLQHNFLC